MLADTTAVPSLPSATPLLSVDEAVLLNALMDNMPPGWAVDFAVDAGMKWAAFVHRADDPRNGPLFTVCRWPDRVGLFVRWTDGSGSVVAVLKDLSPVLNLIPSGIFAFSAARLATVRAESWADTMH
jgi:hypothetical protein